MQGQRVGLRWMVEAGMTDSRERTARKLREKAGELDMRVAHLTHTKATLDGEIVRLAAHAERLRWQAEEMEA